MERKRIAEAAKGIGRPKVGGPFELVDQNGRTFTDRDMKGKYSLVSGHMEYPGRRAQQAQVAPSAPRGIVLK